MDRPDPVRGMAVHLFMDHVGVVRCASFLFERQYQEEGAAQTLRQYIHFDGCIYIYSLSSLPAIADIRGHEAPHHHLPARSHLKNGSLHCPSEVGSVKKSTEVQSNRPLPTLLAAIAQNAGSSRVGSDSR